MVGEKAFPFIATLLIFSVVLFLVFGFLFPNDAGISFSAGLLSIFAPSLLFCFIVSKGIPKEPKKQLKRFYIAEASKLVTFGVLCGFFVFALPMKPIWFFCALVLGQLSYFILGLSLRGEGKEQRA